MRIINTMQNQTWFAFISMITKSLKRALVAQLRKFGFILQWVGATMVKIAALYRTWNMGKRVSRLRTLPKLLLGPPHL